jgi:predicted ribosomally synthesized peptide with nif11-like leader
MSRATDFVSTLQNDSALQSKMTAATSSEERKKIVTDAGYGDVSSSDVKSVLSQQSSGELSDEQLGAASGAGGFHIDTPFGGGGLSW